ncbi:MAG: DNA adenine methylase [Candidatus Omnitrophota bacterium]|nr:MAG: DNA adenine methylase [Candidatus Omnitrophota bacterium]
MAGITRPALRYHGGKWKLAPWIIQHFPGHTTYVEPFGGGASVILRKHPSFIEVYNDLNGQVVNFFRILRERPADLIAAIDLTPYSREEFLLSQQDDIDLDALERARRFYIWSWQGRGRAGVNEPGGWRFMSRRTRYRTPVDDFNNVDHLWGIVRRLKQVHIECDPYQKIILRYDSPETLFYLDPPYVQDTRCYRWMRDGYRFDMTDDEHRELARVVSEIKGMAIISGYPSDLYDELFAGWTRVDRRAAKDNGIKTATECIWISPGAVVQPRLV